VGKEEVRKHYESGHSKIVKLSWEPILSNVASSCDLGYTYGKYTFSFPGFNREDSMEQRHIPYRMKRQAQWYMAFVWD